MTDTHNTSEESGRTTAAVEEAEGSKKDPVSPTKYMVDLIEIMRRKKEMEAVMQRHGKSESVVQENIHRHYGGLSSDMGEIRLKVESANKMLQIVLKQPSNSEFGCTMASEQLVEVIESLDSFVNPF